MYYSRLSDVRVYLNSGDSCGIPLASAIHDSFFWESVYPDCLKNLSLRRIIPASVHHLHIEALYFILVYIITKWTDAGMI